MKITEWERRMMAKGKPLRPKLTPVDDDNDQASRENDRDGLGFDDIVPSMAAAAGPKSRTTKLTTTTIPSRETTTTRRTKARKREKDRYRDPPSPKSILDRDALLDALDHRDIHLKDGHLDAFYRELHRSGYPPLGEFAAALQRGGGMGGRDIDDDDDGRLGSAAAVPGFGTKNAISSRPGRILASRLPSSLLSFLIDDTNDFVTLTSRISSSRTSNDGTTTKLVVELHDGHNVESVLMRHGGSRVTMCVSSQAGCAMGCTFCATGTMGMRGNLSSGEILEQLVHGSRILASTTTSREDGDVGGGGAEEDEYERRGGVGGRPIAGMRRKGTNHRKNNRMDLVRNVVFMGMGEPLNNYDNVLAACRAMIDRRLWNLAHNRVTVSTVGVPSKMRDLTRDLPEVNLALSLHAPDQETRERIVPAARGTPIESLIEALDGHMMALVRRGKLSGNPQGSDHQVAAIGDDGAGGEVEFDIDERKAASKKRRAMIEYVMLVGDTTTIEAAHKLGKLCEGRHLVVNLIPYNKTDVKDELSCPSEAHMREFQSIVSSYGSFCTIRRTMGADIAGACGQLVLEGEEEKSRRKKQQLADIEDGPFRVDESGKPRPPIAAVKRIKEVANETHDVNESKGDDLDPWVRRLMVATVVTATCFVVSSGLMLFQKRKHR